MSTHIRFSQSSCAHSMRHQHVSSTSGAREGIEWREVAVKAGGKKGCLTDLLALHVGQIVQPANADRVERFSLLGRREHVVLERL